MSRLEENLSTLEDKNNDFQTAVESSAAQERPGQASPNAPLNCFSSPEARHLQRKDRGGGNHREMYLLQLRRPA